MIRPCRGDRLGTARRDPAGPRARYDAQAVVAMFTARLRTTVDVDTVRDDLVGAVHQAFQPAHVSVWLPVGTGAERRRSGS